MPCGSSPGGCYVRCRGERHGSLGARRAGDTGAGAQRPSVSVHSLACLPSWVSSKRRFFSSCGSDTRVGALGCWVAPESRVRVSGSSVMTSGFLRGEGPPLSPPAPSPGLFSLWHERGLWVPGPELPAGSSLLGVSPRLRRLLKHNLKGQSAALKGQTQAPQGPCERRRAWD